MRIAFITPTLMGGGYEKVVVSYANELSRRGHQVDILCGKKTGELLGDLNDSIKVYDFDARAREFLLPLVKYLKNNNVNILYCAFREYNCIGVLAKKLAKSNVCIYATQHGFQTDPKVVRYIKGRIISRADRIITVASGIADYESKELGIDRNRFVVLYNPVLDKSVEVKSESHPWFCEKENIPIIVVSGRLAEGKGINYCIEILSYLLKNRTVRMIILGDGPNKKELINLSKRLNVEKSIDFLGYVNNPLGYMKNCSVFLHTALVEGFGNVVVEALYSNIPVCVTNCSGPIEIIENGKYGMDLGSVDAPGFVENAAEKILQVLNGKVMFSGLVERALCFEVQSSTDAFIDLY